MLINIILNNLIRFAFRFENLVSVRNRLSHLFWKLGHFVTGSGLKYGSPLVFYEACEYSKK